MTVKELIAILETYPSDMNVKASCEMFIRDVDSVGEVLDIDTNIFSVEIICKERAYGRTNLL